MYKIENRIQDIYHSSSLSRCDDLTRHHKSLPYADLLSSRDVIQPLKATNVARGHYDSLPAALQRHSAAQPFARGFIGGASKSAEGRARRQVTGLAS